MLTNKHLFDKLYKFYQGEDRFLILVIYGKKDDAIAQINYVKDRLIDFNTAPYSQHVAILTI